MVPGSQCSLNSRFHRIAVLVPDAPGRSPVGSSLGCDGQFISWFLYLVLKFPVRILYIRAIYLLHCFSSLYLFFSFLYLFFKKQTSYFNVWEVAYCSSEEIPGLFVERTSCQDAFFKELPSCSLSPWDSPCKEWGFKYPPPLRWQDGGPGGSAQGNGVESSQETPWVSSGLGPSNN